MDAGQFLRELWGDPPPGYVLVWMLPQKHSTWYFKLDGVAAQLEGYADRDIHTGVGIAAPDAKLDARSRLKASDVAGIPGLWADIDVAGPAHKKPNLPPTEEDARGLLGKLPFAPTILVHSGHGLQGWWLFEEPWIFQSEEERYQAQALARWWHGKLAALSHERGWTLDATHDLARVMRLPGTYNNKVERVPVAVLHGDGPRVSRQEFLDLVPMTQEKVVEQICMPVVGEIALSADAEPPVLKLLSLMEYDQKFKRSWEHRRPDFHDQSASIYDQSLASLAVGAGWTDQEAANLMIAHRRKYGEDLKLREDYYHRTICTAKEPMVGAKAQRALEELLDDNPNPEDILDRLSNVLGVRIVRFIRWSSNDGEPSFDLEIEECETVHFDSVTGITNPKRFCDRVLAATGRVIESGTPKEWKARVQALFNAREERDTGDDTSRESYALKLLGEYFDYSNNGADSRDKGLAQRKHWIEEGYYYYYFFLQSFIKWAGVQHTMRYTAKGLGRMLQVHKAENQRLHTESKDGSPTTRSVWKILIRKDKDNVIGEKL